MVGRDMRQVTEQGIERAILEHQDDPVADPLQHHTPVASPRSDLLSVADCILTATVGNSWLPSAGCWYQARLRRDQPARVLVRYQGREVINA